MLRLRRLGSLLVVALAVLAAPSAAAAKPAKKHTSAVASRDADKRDADKRDADKKEPASKGSASKGSAAKGSAAKSSAGKSSAAKGKVPKGGLSSGAPNAGKLSGAIRLRGSRSLRQREGAHSWALPALVRLLQRAAGHVAKKHKDAVMLVGDLSGRTGGPLEGLSSHQSGRDADIGFYVLNSHDKPVNVRHFVAFDSSGKGRELPWATFDDARNWTLIEGLLNDDKAPVHYLFLKSALRARLLAYAAKKHVPKELIARAAAVMSSKDAEARDDHIHVRIACPESMRDVCIEEPTARGDRSAARASDADAADAKPSAADSKPEAPAPDAEGAGKSAP